MKQNNLYSQDLSSLRNNTENGLISTEREERNNLGSTGVKINTKKVENSHNIRADTPSRSIRFALDKNRSNRSKSIANDDDNQQSKSGTTPMGRSKRSNSYTIQIKNTEADTPEFNKDKRLEKLTKNLKKSDNHDDVNLKKSEKKKKQNIKPDAKVYSKTPKNNKILSSNINSTDRRRKSSVGLQNKLSNNYLTTEVDYKKLPEARKSCLKHSNFSLSKRSIQSNEQDVIQMNKKIDDYEKTIRASNTLQVHQRRASIYSEHKNVRSVEKRKRNVSVCFSSNKNYERNGSVRSLALSQSNLSANYHISPNINYKAYGDRNIKKQKNGKAFQKIKIGNRGSINNDQNLPIKNIKTNKLNKNSKSHLDIFVCVFIKKII